MYIVMKNGMLTIIMPHGWLCVCVFKIGCRLSGLCTLIDELSTMVLLTPTFAQEIGFELPSEAETSSSSSNQAESSTSLTHPTTGEPLEKRAKKSTNKKKKSKAELMANAKKAVSASMKPFRPGGSYF
jgi:hypothetical protein